jgi:hypothetical protein
MRALSSSVLVIVSAGLVAACGGGGDGDSGPSIREPFAINANNGQRIAKAIVKGSESFTSVGGAAVFTAAAVSERNRFLGLRVLAYELALERLAAGIPSGGEFSTAETATDDCPGDGSFAVGATDKNHNGQLDDGDSASIAHGLWRGSHRDRHGGRGSHQRRRGDRARRIGAAYPAPCTCLC